MSLPDLPHPFSRAEAESAGLGRRALDEALRLGRVRRLRQGWYAVARAEPAVPGDPRWQRVVQEHLDRVRQHLRRLPGHVASHTSAALVHGFAVLVSPDSPVELTAVERVPRSRREKGLVVHHCDSTDTPVEVVDGLRVTTAPRTVADTARSRTLPHGTALVDDVLRTGRVTERQLLDILGLQKRWVGRPRALVAVALSDVRRESWLESFSDVRLHELGVPLPLPQATIYDDRMRPVARVDGLDPEHGIVREADGLGKYFLDVGASVTPEQSALGRLGAEAVRGERLTSLGLRLLRWTSDQIRLDPERVASRWKSLRQEPVPPITAYAEWEGELRRLPFAVDRPQVDLARARTSRRRRRGADW